ncbi:enoyl-CoA hydratase/isomerase family protein [Streptomyces profundus]|uniref:enoyl-CoA hydratase/isomerase family protein n=1 Tax=Streptomyces profundus TaxID=2867410 RepID=UPI001D16C399|nr:enoyl-CoA hydratase-related protein [Streptomyces sp. MA3_2.13]UED84340.1 enoyl-CoA hydratase/isomerase family protein [Streptomyces sp. MA3_2.13]
MTETVLYEVTESLATVTLNRPEAMNALNHETKEALRDRLAEAAADSRVRAVLLAANGRAFCVGQDLREHAAALEGDGDPLATVRAHYSPIARTLSEMRKPVVAAVNGVAAGAGFGFALAADYRVVARGASFHTAFAGIGLAADSGLSWTLPRTVGRARAAELLLFPRAVEAAEAEQLGLAQRVVPDEELAASARAVAVELSRGPTLAYAALRDALDFATEHGLAASLEKEAELQSALGATRDHRGAVAAFLAKRRPDFDGA